MSWSEMFPAETERSLLDRAQRPKPMLEPEASVWAKAQTLVASPFTGFAQGVNQTLRVAGRVVNAIPGGASEEIRARNQEIATAVDDQLRSGANYWAPDRMTSTFASNFLHEGARVMTKVAGYSMAGGLPAAVVGTGADEGVTQYLTLRDSGVDPETAAKVGGVRALSTAASVAVPAAGSTIARTAGLVALSGPGLYVAEQSASRAILEQSRYLERAAEFDPWDPVGLTASLVPGAAVGTAVHMARARRAKAAEAAPAQAPAADPVPAEMVEAAHVQFQQQVVDAHALAGMDDLTAKAAHSRAVSDAYQALDEGRPMELGEIRVDETRAAAVMAEVQERLALARKELGQEGGEPVPIDRSVLRVLDPDPPEVAQARAAVQRILESQDPGLRESLGSWVRSPAAMNLVQGMLYAGRDSTRAEGLLQEFTRRVSSPQFRGRARVDIAADIVDEMNGRLPPQAVLEDGTPSPTARAQRIVGSRPDMPVRLDESEPVGRRAADVMTAEGHATQAELVESRKAFATAIECVLSIGE